VSRYELVKIGEKYTVRKRMFLIGPYEYFTKFGVFVFLEDFDHSYFEFELEDAEMIYDFLTGKSIEVIK
jgi:hypothetical protein